MSKTSSSLCGPLQPTCYLRAAKRPVLVTNRLRYGLVLIFGAVTVVSLLQPSDVFAQGANASPQGQPFQQLQVEIQQGDQNSQEQIDAVEETSTQADKDLQTQINGLSAQLAEALEFISFLQLQLADANANISDLQSRVGQLETDLAALQSDPVFALSGFLSDLASFVTIDQSPVDLDDDLATDVWLDRILFEGVNVQIVNGGGSTNTTNGLGNLIVGYNVQRQSPAIHVCSVGGFFAESTCEDNNGTWARNHKTGSHNIVAGDANAYSQYGGVVFGLRNAITAPYAVVTAGTRNIAANGFASVSGGDGNSARGGFSSVSGGSDHQADGLHSSISGGQSNSALGVYGSISGGQHNGVGATWASVSGGTINNAFANHSSISGGQGGFAGTPGCWQGGTFFDTC